MIAPFYLFWFCSLGGRDDQYTNLDLLVQSAISTQEIHPISDQILPNIRSEVVYHRHLWKCSFC